MVKLTRIYTRGGDKGETSLGDGARVPKHDPRVAAFGDVEEANAAIGLARLHAGAQMDPLLVRIQNDLFDLGADLCVPEPAPGEAPPERARLRMSQAQVARLEAEIDERNAALGPLESFVLPAGNPAAAHLHLARTVLRRAERAIVALAQSEAVNPAALAYVNRLSDLIFVLARQANAAGAGDVLWVPGANRDGGGEGGEDGGGKTR